jgi:hypothetical protein
MHRGSNLLRPLRALGRVLPLIPRCSERAPSPHLSTRFRHFPPQRREPPAGDNSHCYQRAVALPSTVFPPSRPGWPVPTRPQRPCYQVLRHLLPPAPGGPLPATAPVRTPPEAAVRVTAPRARGRPRRRAPILRIAPRRTPDLRACSRLLPGANKASSRPRTHQRGVLGHCRGSSRPCAFASIGPRLAPSRQRRGPPGRGSCSYMIYLLADPEKLRSFITLTDLASPLGVRKSPVGVRKSPVGARKSPVGARSLVWVYRGAKCFRTLAAFLAFRAAFAASSNAL